MAEKPKPKRARGDDSGVLASLPATRPNRLGRHNRATTTAKAAAKPSATARPKAKPKALKAVKAPPKVKAKPKARPAPKPVAITEGQRPRAVRSGAKGLSGPAKTAAAKRAPAPDKSPSGTELVSTVVQAAGELAQVGLSIGGQVLKRAVERLPKP
jgi:hypothetical protein